MRPIHFTATTLLTLTPEQIANRIAAVESWTDFRGYGIVPGIRSARYEWSTDSMEGARVRVENLNGARHVAEIIRWDVPRSVVLRRSDFSPPLRRLAAYIQEEWTFEEHPGGTLVRRTFTLQPNGTLSRFALWIVSRFLREAVDRHLRHLSQVRPGHAPA
jgi:hypothetical protein